MRPEPPHQMAGDCSVGHRPQGTHTDGTDVCVCVCARERERQINNVREDRQIEVEFYCNIGTLVWKVNFKLLHVTVMSLSKVFHKVSGNPNGNWHQLNHLTQT